MYTVDIPIRRTRRTTPKTIIDNDEFPLDEVRRSGRTRKLMYGTFDQKVLERALYDQRYEHESSRKRKTREVDAVDVEVCVCFLLMFKFTMINYRVTQLISILFKMG